MDRVFQCLTDLTAQRDHIQLHAAMLSAIQSCVGASSGRVMEIDMVNHVRDIAWFIDDGKGVELAGRSSVTAAAEPLNEPALEECLRERRHLAIDKTADGAETIWIPVYRPDAATLAFEVRCRHGFSGQDLSVVNGIFGVYRNFLTLLDDNQKDSLTGLLNRKTFDERFTSIVPASVDHGMIGSGSDGERRSEKSEASQWIAVVDVDHFKRVNDTFGHLYGDEVLLLLSGIMKNTFRSGDEIFRFGGEEFVILIRRASLEDSKAAMERFRTTVESYSFPQVGHITVSAGIVEIKAGQSPVSVLGMADEALYFAKQSGRNRNCWYSELVAAGHIKTKEGAGDIELFT